MYLVRSSFLLRRIYKRAIWRMPQGNNCIYLTFDDGPIPEITPWVLSTLEKYKAYATFFCVGDNVKKHPGIYNEILSRQHSVGNHTLSHLKGWNMPIDLYIENIEQCGQLVHSSFFRPPYGKMKLNQYQQLHKKYSIVMWDVLSGDFDKRTSKERCLKNVIDNTRDGSIVVFHDNLKAKDNLYYVLPKFLEYFSNEGFIFNKL